MLRAWHGDGKHKISLDKVIKATRDTGRDMQDKYKEKCWRDSPRLSGMFLIRSLYARNVGIGG